MITSDDLAERCHDDPRVPVRARASGRAASPSRSTASRPRCASSTATRRLVPLDDGPGVIGLAGERAIWDAMLSAEPPRFFNDIGFATALGLERTGDDLTFWQYYPAVMRAVELLRPAVAPAHPPDGGPDAKRFDSPSAATCTSSSTASTTASTSRRPAPASRC